MFAVTPMALSRCALLEGGSLAQVEGSVTRTVVLFLIFFLGSIAHSERRFDFVG
jgi:hypothetical protein